ncbi:MAG: 3'-5' exonuclease domain-containing protein 2 [Desulfovibrionaceae bacterium]|nr:3'-5' exonuclease domain-containing protein 2 [Desulfovibrionaceae bacterium]
MNTPLSFSALSKEAINALPLYSYQGDIRLAENAEEAEKALHILSQENILGFDTETRPVFRRGKTNLPSLVQLAGQKSVVLIRLNRMPFPDLLAEILENQQILKIGVAIHDDMIALNRLRPFIPRNTADLALLAQQHGIEARGLRTMAASVLGIRISKSVQCSNWAQPVLTPQQITYAATDAWIGRKLYCVLETL